MDIEAAFKKWGAHIYSFVYMRVQCREVAEDIVQEAFMKAWKSKDTFNAQKASLKTWLFQIAINCTYDHFRKHRKPTVELKDELMDKSANIDKKASVNSDIEYVFGKLKKLKDRDQELLILRYKNDLSVKDIAQVMDMEYEATKVALHRALNRLSKICDKQM